MNENDNEPVLTCYKIDDDDEAFQCIKELVAAGKDKEDGCRPRILLFSQPNCVPCAEERAHFKEDIAAGIVEVVDIETPEGLVLAKKADCLSVPMVAIVDCGGDLIIPPGAV